MRLPQEVALHFGHKIEDLDGVEGGAFAELVAAGEELDASAVGLTYLLADAADEDVVAPGSINGYWKTIRLHIVYHCYARRL